MEYLKPEAAAFVTALAAVNQSLEEFKQALDAAVITEEENK